MTFELLIAIRYLRAKRKQAAISLITFIAILGVGAGVAALVVAMAVSEGQREDIRDRLLGAQAVITGMRPDAARQLAELGVDGGSIITLGTLKDGFRFARARGYGEGAGRRRFG